MTLLDQLFALRDQQRAAVAKGLRVVHGKDRPLERNDNGYMKWYMHPLLNDTVTKALIVFMQEIPPASRTGKQKTQGGMVLYILEGTGYTMLDETRHEWSQGDVLNIPQRDIGVTLHHFNTSSEKVARFLSVQPNLVDSLGVDRGAGFEQIEKAPKV